MTPGKIAILIGGILIGYAGPALVETPGPRLILLPAGICLAGFGFIFGRKDLSS